MEGCDWLNELAPVFTVDMIGHEPNNKQNIYKDHVISYTYKNVQFASCVFRHGMTEGGLACFPSTH